MMAHPPRSSGIVAADVITGSLQGEKMKTRQSICAGLFMAALAATSVLAVVSLLNAAQGSHGVEWVFRVS